MSHNKKTISSLLVIFVLVFLTTACQEKFRVKVEGKPREIIRAYIEKSFNVKKISDRKDLQAYLTGETKKRLVAWSDDQFRKAFLDTKRKFLRLSFKEVKGVSENEVTVTYEIAYLDQGREHEARVTNKKLSYLSRINGKWKIREVKNIKELIEFKNEMSLP